MGRGPLCVLLLAAWVAARPAGAEEATPPAGRGSIVGQVLDARTARPILAARVEIDGDPDSVERTDLDGRYTLFAAPGTHAVRISSPLYQETLVESVVVTEGRSTRLDASLTPRVDASIEVIDVVADVTEATEATQLLKRRLAPSVSDTLGAQSISKTPDSDAAAVVARVPAVTIKDSKFIVVRGLGERYSTAVLNGSRLPSTDPNKRVPPLDLFPADFIESLSVIKSYTPDLPGDFSGGLLDIELAEPPAQLRYSLGASVGVNTETTFQSFDTYAGSTADWFALGDGYRSLPSVFGGQPSSVTRASTTPQMRALVGSLPLNWNIDSATAPPNFGVNASIGNTYGPFGFNLAGTYGTKHSVHRQEQVTGFPNFQEFEEGRGDRFVYDRSKFEAQLGGVLTTSFKPSLNHRFDARALVNRKGVDEVLNGEGITENDPDFRTFASQAVYTVDQLGLGQLEGRHHWSFVDVDWRASWAPSTQTQPDAKYLIYQNNLDQPEQPPRLRFKVPSTLRTFADLNEFLQDYYVDLTFPFRTALPFTDVWSGLAAQLEAGVAYAQREREFRLRRFRTITNVAVPESDPLLAQPPDTILVAERYGRGAVSGVPFTFNETTLEGDSFDASQEIAGVYAMLELPIVPERLRLVGGARLEYSYIEADGATLQGPAQARINDLDPLPGVSLIYSPREDMNVRLAYSQTVSRPEFRELTPTLFPTAPGERTLQGFAGLTSADITSYDLRWEWFFSPLELFSASAFYKELENPIEQITIPATSELRDSFRNASDATVWGFELEGRKNFGFLGPVLRRWQSLRWLAPKLADLQLLANIAIVESEVSGIVGAVSSPNRQLQGQSPLVVNAILEYEHYRWGLFRLLYNTVDRSIVAVGADLTSDDQESAVPLPDIFDERRDQLDFVWMVDVEPFGTPLTLKFAVENILNDDFVRTQGDQITNRYRTGATFGFGASYEF